MQKVEYKEPLLNKNQLRIFMNKKTYKSLFVILTIIALAANSASIVRADNEGKGNKNESTKKLTQQVKKIAELNNELNKEWKESENENRSSVPASMPASVAINPNGETKLNNAEVVTAPGVASSTTLTARVWGITFTLAIDGGSKLKARGGAIAASQIQIGDRLNITGLANAAAPLTIQVKQLDDMTLNTGNSGSNEELTRLRAQIQALMDKLNALLAHAGGNATTTIPNPVVVPVIIPTITSVSPATTTASSTAFTLTVNGTNFATTSVINWGGNALATTFVTGSQLTAVVPAANIATAGSTTITVTTPGIGGGTSNGIVFVAQ